jgi:hypothetical protein
MTDSNRWKFYTYLTRDTSDGTQVAESELVRADLRQQFRYRVMHYRGSVVVEWWNYDPSGVVSVDTASLSLPTRVLASQDGWAGVVMVQDSTGRVVQQCTAWQNNPG